MTNVINCNFVVLSVINMVMTDKYRYCDSLTRYSRLSTLVVPVGDVPLGGTYPIRIQSMTTTNSLDTRATVDQVIRMADAGCDYVRITTQGVREAENLAVIKRDLAKADYRIPIIADIHFNPRVAEVAARLVEKIRINPGNFADKPHGIAVYKDTEYLQGLEKVREKLHPLIAICKQYGTAMRIGGNHGSLSERIMSRYGNSPEGLVESVLEYARICHGEGFHSLVLSVKSSNTRVMVQACRLLVHRMMEEGMQYPVHLGVTEAGGGMDGRIKSAVGIGALLEDGIGDTIRVSLTEDPEFEVPAARKMIDRYNNRPGHPAIPDIDSLPFDPFNYKKRKTRAVGAVGGNQVPVIFSEIGSEGDVLT
jgi:(E)-4-hydroxy-3-methylbut-2-enyl-diphosphate synthase